MRTPLLGAATVAVLAAGALATTGVLGSSHREAPRIMLDPSADNTDVYAFTAPDAPGKLTIVSNWVPLENPAGGPYFGKLDPKARYYVKIDNTGDGVEDVAYRWQFQQRVPQPELVPVRGAAGRLDQRAEPQLPARRTTSTSSATRTARSTAPSGSRTTCRSRPTTSGPRRCPTTRPWPRAPWPTRACGVKTFVGPADDPFFVDLGVRLRRHQHRQARPAGHRPRQPGRRPRRRGRATTSTRSSCRSRTPTSRATASRSPALTRPTPSSACGRPPSAGRSVSCAASTARIGRRSAASATR